MLTLYTFQDMVEQLLDQYDVTVGDRNRRMARQAVLRAYRDLPNRARWTYFDRRNTLLTEASQSTGTTVYDHTGGANERMLTLTGATWPTNASAGRVIISSVHYGIDRYISSTIVTLEENSNPGADVASGTYTWYRSAYQLPDTFRKMNRLYDVENEHEIAIVSVDVHHSASVHFYDTPDTPWEATIRNQGDSISSQSLEFGPPPSTARYYDYTYEAAPRRLENEKYSTGTVTVNGSPTATKTVTGSGTVFPTNCVGSVIRISSTATLPTSAIGSPVPDGSGTDNVFAEQRTIVARTSDTEVTVDTDITSDHSSVGYTISDPIEIVPDSPNMRR